MADSLAPGTGVIYMKVGTHAQESLDDILERKQREIKEAGVSFWGYGGGTCHPLLRVQPFVKERLATGNAIYLAMKPMLSKHFAAPIPAEAYSDDGVTWNSIPKGVEVRGSRYALILDSIEPSDVDLDLGQATVAAGLKRGVPASSYVKGRVDKGCFIVEQSRVVHDEPKLEHIRLIATLKEPYAVLLR